MTAPSAATPRLAIEARVLLVVASAAGTLFALVLAAGAAAGGLHGIDRAVLVWLRGATDGAAWWQAALRRFMLDMTALGDPPMLTLMVLLVAGYLLAARKRRLAAMVVASTALGAATGTLLKEVFARARPDVVTHLVEVRSLSFPSGHAMQSAVIYLTLAALVARSERRQAERIYVLGAAIGLVLLIGGSRLYLGVHWPTDVLAGWTIGAAWAFGTAMLARRLQDRRELEAPE